MLTRSSTHFSSSFRSLSSLCIRWYVGSQSPRFQGMNTTNDGGCKWPVCIIQSSDLIVGLHSAFSKYSDAEKQAQIKKVGLGENVNFTTFLFVDAFLFRQMVSSNWRLRTKARKRWYGPLTWRSPDLSTRAKPNQRPTSQLSLQMIRWLI